MTHLFYFFKLQTFNELQKLLGKTDGKVVGDLMTPAPLVVRETTNLEDAVRYERANLFFWSVHSNMFFFFFFYNSRCYCLLLKVLTDHIRTLTIFVHHERIYYKGITYFSNLGMFFTIRLFT